MVLFAKEKADVEAAKAAQVLAVVCTRDSLEGATLLMKYKVGDWVQIRKDLHLKIYAVYEKMTEYKGLKARIERVNRDGEFYLIDIDGGDFCWTDEMLEDVDEETDATDKTIRPDYYNFHSYDVFDIADYFGLSFPLGNALKYLLRCKHKENEEQDLHKAIKCIERHLEMMKRGKE